jgi:hypothetical protein
VAGVTSTVGFIQLAVSCTASTSFLVLGMFVALCAALPIYIALKGVVDGVGCFGGVLLLAVGVGLAGVGMNGLIGGCH